MKTTHSKLFIVNFSVFYMPHKNRLFLSFFAYLFIAISSALIYSCSPSDQNPVKELPGNVYLVMDNSASMKGYTSQFDTVSFKQQIGDLLARIDRAEKDSSIGIVQFYTTEKDNDWFTMYDKSKDQFSQELSSPNAGLMKNHNSFLHITLDSLVGVLDADTTGRGIGIFITDGILSTPKSSDKTSNRDQLAALSTSLQASFNTIGASKRNYAVYLLQLFSSFKGIYHNYKNGYELINTPITRPYYLIMVGETQIVESFNRQVIEPSIGPFIHNQIAWLGANRNTETAFEVYGGLPLEGGSGMRSYDGKGLDDIDFSKPPTFLVALDLPSFILKDSTLLQSIQLGPEGVVDSAYFFTISGFRESRYYKKIAADSNKDEQYFQKHNLFGVIKLKAKQPGNRGASMLTLSLKNPLASGGLPKWIDLFETDNDTNSTVVASGKTFGLRSLADAMAKSLRSREQENYFNITISLNR